MDLVPHTPPSPTLPLLSVMRASDRTFPAMGPNEEAPSLPFISLIILEKYVKDAGLSSLTIFTNAVALFRKDYAAGFLTSEMAKNIATSSLLAIAGSVGAFKEMFCLRLLQSSSPPQQPDTTLDTYDRPLDEIVQPLVLNTSQQTDTLLANYAQEFDKIFEKYVFQAEIELYLDKNNRLPQDIKTLIDTVIKKNPTSTRDPLVQVVEFLMQPNRWRSIQKPSASQQQQLSLALEKFAIVQNIYGKKLAAQPGEGISGINIQPTADALNQKHHLKYAPNLYSETIPQAIGCYLALVEKERQPPIEHVTSIRIHADTYVSKNEVKMFRANAEEWQNVISISVLAKMTTIVHEIGHQVEFYLPFLERLTIHLFLRSRQRSPKLIDIYGNKKELALDVDLPGFPEKRSKYVARVYRDGNTEVVSMTLETLCDPQGTKMLITSDPLFTAMLLRVLRPHDIETHLSADLLNLLPTWHLDD